MPFSSWITLIFLMQMNVKTLNIVPFGLQSYENPEAQPAPFSPVFGKGHFHCDEPWQKQTAESPSAPPWTLCFDAVTGVDASYFPTLITNDVPVGFMNATIGLNLISHASKSATFSFVNRWPIDTNNCLPPLKDPVQC